MVSRLDRISFFIKVQTFFLTFQSIVFVQCHFAIDDIRIHTNLANTSTQLVTIIPIVDTHALVPL